MTGIPLADHGRLRREGRRTAVAGFLVAALAVGAIAGFVLAGRHPQVRSLVPLPARANAIVVLDLSASISSDTYSRIGSTLATLAHGGGRYGLIVFSEEAYEALPAGTPAADLAPLARYFTLPSQARPGFAPSFPTNPWQNTFSAGTRISAGLELAHSIALEDRLRRPAVILISDLDDSPGDLPRLTAIALAYRRDRIPLRVVGLNPTPDDAALFQRLAGSTHAVVQAPPPVGPRRAGAASTEFPWTLVALTLASACLLAAGAAWAPRLDWQGGGA